jgi:hypothetical protein
MNLFDLANVYRIATDTGASRLFRSSGTFCNAAAGIAADNARSWRIVRAASPGRSGAPPRPVGVKK